MGSVRDNKRKVRACSSIAMNPNTCCRRVRDRGERAISEWEPNCALRALCCERAMPSFFNVSLALTGREARDRPRRVVSSCSRSFSTGDFARLLYRVRLALTRIAVNKTRRSKYYNHWLLRRVSRRLCFTLLITTTKAHQTHS